MSQQRVYLQALVFGAMLCLGLPVGSSAQSGGSPPRSGDRGGERQGASRMNEQQREALERRFHERMDVIVKQRLQLSDDQHVKLRAIASRTEEARRGLRRDELTARTALRREMMAGERAGEARVAELLEQMPMLERRKLELMETEQREMAKFLSPLQRARYFGLQDELRRGMQELQRRRMGMPDSLSAPPDTPAFRRRGTPPPRP
jgi:protein CpxP